MPVIAIVAIELATVPVIEYKPLPEPISLKVPFPDRADPDWTKEKLPVPSSLKPIHVPEKSDDVVERLVEDLFKALAEVLNIEVPPPLLDSF